MGLWQPVTNLRDYVHYNPPGVTFFLCLLNLTLSFIFISFYSYTHTLPNPDVAKVHLCMKANVSSAQLVTPVPSPLKVQETKRNHLNNSPKTRTPVTHLNVKVPLTVITNSAGSHLEGIGLYTSLEASQLSLAGNEIVNVTINVLSGNDTFTCLTISAPTYLLPLDLLPPDCPVSGKFPPSIHAEVSRSEPVASHICYSLQAQHDPTLTVMLTQEQQQVAVQHLLEVGVCLLGVCLILCLTASLTRSLMPYRRPGLDLRKENLLSP
ncbi:transmembrane protein 248 isoform X2 [Thalassophryne amazonica]|uniref:transmembrane protein 248 isoform X2 n=1 Tax=Thalassophryne amazonica TaxID=390379 RepID=UPI0014712F0A|nr:transmembrane protein 248 isoform X2 [Thalassophryne amazonica]